MLGVGSEITGWQAILMKEDFGCINFPLSHTHTLRSGTPLLTIFLLNSLFSGTRSRFILRLIPGNVLGIYSLG